MLLNFAKCQSYSYYQFWVIKGRPTGRQGGEGGLYYSPPRLGSSHFKNTLYIKIPSTLMFCFLRFANLPILVSKLGNIYQKTVVYEFLKTKVSILQLTKMEEKKLPRNKVSRKVLPRKICFAIFSFNQKCL